MKIEYKRLYEQVINILRKKIDNGEFKVNERLPSERELAKDMEVSRGTLRDAFRVLESQGIIETKPGGGRILKNTIPASFTPDQKFVDKLRKAAILELIEAREILEVGMMDLICKYATDEELEELKATIEGSRDEQTSDEKNHDFIFHYSLAKYSKNNVLLNFMELNLNIIKEARTINFTKEEHYIEASKEHFKILDALIKRDSNLAKKEMISHFNNMKKRIGKQV